MKSYKKIDLVALQILLSRSEDEGMCCEVVVNEVKLRKYWLSRSGLPISRGQAIIEGKSEVKRSEEMTLDLNGVGKCNESCIKQVATTSDTLTD